MSRLLLAGLLVAGCAPSAPPVVTAADATRTHVALAELQEGRAMLVSKCSGCHVTPLPAEHRAGEWPLKLDEMADRSRLDTAQRRVIEAYLVAMAPR